MFQRRARTDMELSSVAWKLRLYFHFQLFHQRIESPKSKYMYNYVSRHSRRTINRRRNDCSVISAGNRVCKYIVADIIWTTTSISANFIWISSTLLLAVCRSKIITHRATLPPVHILKLYIRTVSPIRRHATPFLIKISKPFRVPAWDLLTNRRCISTLHHHTK